MDLDDFADRWYRACATRDPDQLAPLITAVEPYREVALRDAVLLARLPVMRGLGMEVRASAGAASAFAGWERSIAPFRYQLRWQDTMATDSTESTASGELERIALEDGEWRVVAIFGERSRAEATMFAALLANR